MIANFLESLRWTDKLAKLASPLARFAHLSPVSSAAFALAFISPASANGLLSEAYEQKKLNMAELTLANLFNSLPAWFSHIPTIFFLAWPVLGFAAVIYVGIALLAALGRTIFTIILARLLLPPAGAPALAESKEEIEPFPPRLRKAMLKAWQRFKKRMPRLIMFTGPIYLLMYFCQQWGIFAQMEAYMASHLQWLAFVKPQAMGIIVMQMVAEMGAALGAASAVLADSGLNARDVVIAMLVGNVLAAPIRAIRHQLPAYAGFYRPAIAIKLICANQALRACSMAVMIGGYILL